MRVHESPIYQCKGWFPHSLRVGPARKCGLFWIVFFHKNLRVGGDVLIIKRPKMIIMFEGSVFFLRLLFFFKDSEEWLGGGFKYFLFSPRSLGKWSNLTSIFFKRVAQPPPRWRCEPSKIQVLFWVDIGSDLHSLWKRVDHGMASYLSNLNPCNSKEKKHIYIYIMTWHILG